MSESGPLIRTFVAVSVSDAVRTRASQLIERLKPGGAKVSWVAPGNMHMTMKFLGDQSQEQVAVIRDAVRQAAESVGAFEFCCHGVGAFPNARRPRTIWIGVSDGAAALSELHARIDAALARHRFAKDRTRFCPHLTLGRVRSSGPGLQLLGDLLERLKDEPVGSVRASQVLVMASQLLPSGPLYEVLARAPLAGGGQDEAS